MSTTIDSKVVEMKFDNKNFESNVATTMSTLDRLKRALNLNGASKGLNDVASSTGKVNGPMAGLASAVETVRSKFSALEVMGITALANITNSAVNAGKRIAASLTIEPIKTGFQEYETQINAVQTILANTKSKGTTLDDVNSALDELNTYADKTIYNFTEMTRNIGTFTAAGVDLDTSVSAIKGIANLAAVSGSSSQQASTAMYQLSQALASGTVKLQDWNSVVNAGMGGQVFQDSLKETARLHGVNIDQMIKHYGSFRETLKDGWLTSDILTETLAKFTGDLTEADLKKMGYTKKQIKEIMELGEMANDAATKVKTLTQLYDTLKEAAQSGWAQSWKIIVGDFEEAKALFTEIGDTLSKMIGNSAESRNKVLQDWKDMGGRTMLVDSLKNAFEGIMSIIKPIREAFREVFPPITAETLLKLTENLKKFTEGLKLSGETSDKVKSIFKGLFSIIDIVRKVISAAVGALFGLSQSEGVGSLADFVLDTAAAIGDFFTSINENFDTDGIAGVFSTIGSGISKLFEGATGGLKGFGEILSSAGEWIVGVAETIWKPIKTVFTWIKENVSLSDVFAGLAGGGIFVAAKKLSGLFDTITDAIDGLTGKGDGGLLKNLKENLSDVLGSVKESLQAFTSGVRIWSLVGIAVAVGVLAHSLRTLSELRPAEITKSLVGIGIALSMLMIGFKSMTKSLSKYESSGIIKSAIALIVVAKAVDILADVIIKISDLPMKSIFKGLAGIAGGIALLCGGLKIIGKTKISMSTSVAILALAASCSILGDALKKFANMSWSEIGRGLTAMGGALAEVVAAVAILGKFGGAGSLFGSVGVFIVIQGLGDMADALKKFGEMSWSEIGRGLSGMGGALAEVSAALTLVGKVAGFSSIFAAAAIWVVIQGLDDLADSLKKFGEMTWSEIGRGLSGMGGALAEVSVALIAVGKIAGFSSIFAAAAIWAVIQGLDDVAAALKDIGEMTWSEIGKGLTGMGGALAEIGVVVGAVGKIAGFSSIFAAAALWVVMDGLDDIAASLKAIGEMTWSEIAKGLTGMGGALAEIGVVAGVLGTVAGFSSIFGAAALWTVMNGLGDMADALKKIGDMTWSEIGKGLTGMAGALAEVSVVAGVLGTLAGIPALIGSASVVVAVQGLGTMADALKKFGDMDWDEIKKGLAGMGGALGEIALGGILNTFSLLGAASIAAVAKPIGTLADSMKKWEGVNVPSDLATQLGYISAGMKSFTWAFAGGWSLSAIVGPLGTLADSIKKWEGITVPVDLQTWLTNIATGMKSFTWAFMGGWSLTAVVGPLGTLADSVKKWVGVTVPEDLQTWLTSIATGMKSFTWAFAGGWSLYSITGPLSTLADSVKKWEDVTVPDDLETWLTGIATGMKAFTFSGFGGAIASLLTDTISDLGAALQSWKDVDLPKSLGTKLKGLVTGLEALSDFDDYYEIDDILTGVKDLGTGLEKISNLEMSEYVSNIGDVLDMFSKLDEFESPDLKAFKTSIGQIETLATTLNDTAKDFTDAGEAVLDAIYNGLASEEATSKIVTSAQSLMINTIKKTLTDSSDKNIPSVGKGIVTNLSKGITDKKKSLIWTIKLMMSSSLLNMRLYYMQFYSAGSYLVTGFANGISANSFRASIKASAMASAAIKAAKEKLAINSPSKVFRAIGAGIPEGFAQGIATLGSHIKGAVGEMSDTAIDGTRRAISNVSDIVSGNIDTQPTIRPVVDLSNVRAGASAINGMFNMTPSVGLLSNLGSINAMMNRRNQNGTNDDVVSAIGKLEKTMGNVKGDTYTFGNITYGDDSAITEAVQALINAIIVERRT